MGVTAGTRRAWECDGVASNVTLGIRQLWGVMLAVLGHLHITRLP